MDHTRAECEKKQSEAQAAVKTKLIPPILRKPKHTNHGGSSPRCMQVNHLH